MNSAAAKPDAQTVAPEASRWFFGAPSALEEFLRTAFDNFADPAVRGSTLADAAPDRCKT
jgi:hypothetical protein